MATTKPAHRYAENGKRIRRARKLTGLSQFNFGLEIGVTRRQMIRLENGEHLPSRPVRDRIEKRAGLSKGEIRSADDDEEGSLMAALQARIDEVQSLLNSFALSNKETA